jgi:hypothetical protein
VIASIFLVRRRGTALLAAALLIGVAVRASAQVAEPALPELVTDRPDFTESSEVVGHGVLQVESGFTFESDRLGSVTWRSITTPSMLVRLGLGRRVELRFGGDGFLRGWTNIPSADAESGYSDVELGVKIKFLARERFDMSVIPIVSVPTRNTFYSSNSYDTTVKLTWAAALPRDFDLSGNVNVARLSDLRRFTQSAVSVSVGHDLAAGWAGYWEAYGFMPMVPGAGAGWTLNTGVTRGIGNNMQFDVEVGRGVTTAAPDWFVGFGFAVRKGLLRGDGGQPRPQ